MRDPYSVLGVPKNADADTIRKKYKELARKYHPDLNKNAGAADRFKEINDANEIIGDAEKRKLWDEFGEMSTKPGFNADQARAWKSGGGFGGGFPGGGFGGGGFGGGGFPGGGFGGFGGGVNLDDLFGGFGTGGGGRRGPGGFRRAPPRGADIEVSVAFSIPDFLSGERRPISYPRVGDDGTMQMEIVKFGVPAGIRPGATVRLRGKGSAGPAGGEAGDLRVTVEVAPHPYLTIDGDNVMMDVPVTLGEAFLGGPISVPTPGGTIKVTLPPGTNSGKRLRLRGKGLRMKDDSRGDLYFVVRPMIPEGQDPVLQDLVNQLEAFYPANVRAGLTFDEAE